MSCDVDKVTERLENEQSVDSLLAFITGVTKLAVFYVITRVSLLHWTMGGSPDDVNEEPAT